MSSNHEAKQDSVSSLSVDLPSILFSFTVALGLFFAFAGKLSFWSRTGETLWFGSSGSTLPVIAVLLIICTLLVRGRVNKLRFEAMGFGLGFFVLFFSDWMTRPYSFFPGPSIRGELFIGFLFTLFLIRRNISRFVKVFAIAAPLVLFWCFFVEADGRLLFSDDHPAFLYRLQLLAENFPSIPFYNPLWNSGVESREFFPSGVLNMYLLGYPLIKIFGAKSVYNLLIAAFLFVLVPAVSFLAARYLTADRLVPPIASVLSISSSLLWYRWGLTYGAMGFVVSAALIPLVAVLVARFFEKGYEFNAVGAALFVISGTLMLFWSITGVVFLPLCVLGLVLIGRLWRKRYSKWIVFAFVALNLPWVVLFLRFSYVGQFVSLTANKPAAETSAQHEHATDAQEYGEWSDRVVKRERGTINLRECFQAIRNSAVPTNPLLWLLVLPGILLLPAGMVQLVFGLLMTWLLFLGTVVDVVVPHLEFERMLVVFGQLAAIPVAFAIAAIFSYAAAAMTRSSLLQRVSAVAIAALVGGFLFTGPFVTGSVVMNRAPIRYFFAEPVVAGMSEAIARYSAGGRVVFPGFMLHQLSGGHIAPLALFTKTPLLASFPYHSEWRYSEHVPAEYRGAAGEKLEEYFELQNAALVITWDPRWRRKFRVRPDLYELVWRKDNFRMYRRRHFKGSYFFSGKGALISQSSSSVTLRVDSVEAVVKFNYLPFLDATGCKISGYHLPGDIEFVKLRECRPGSEVTLRARGAWQRFFE